jgi:hypothetical protein
VLSWLTQGFGDGEPMRLKAWVASESPSRLTHPDLDVLASVTRAIHQECPLGIEYHSISSGRTEREIVPFALIDNGLRWHVRAFDRKSQEFRDFVITRIKRPVVIKGQQCQPHERSDQDIQWTRIVELELVPHPDQPRPEITEMDYGMRGRRAADEAAGCHSGYILRKWSVDCSPDHSLRGHEFRLWLKDASGAVRRQERFAGTGYRSPDQSQGRAIAWPTIHERALELLRIGSGRADATFVMAKKMPFATLSKAKAACWSCRRPVGERASSTFIATKLLREGGNGPALLISPLLALMRNQIAGGASAWELRAATINSDNRDRLDGKNRDRVSPGGMSTFC